MKKKSLCLSLIFSIMMIFSFSVLAYTDEQNGTTTVNTTLQNGQNGTTLINANVMAASTWEKIFNWGIDKTVSPSVWNFFQGDSGTSKYTIDVTKDNGTDSKYIEGTVTVTNGGAVSTENLAITVKLTNPSGSETFIDQTVDVSKNSVLDPGETGSYSYTIPYPGATAGQNYKVTADITITNHSGSLGTPSGPSPSKGFQFPSSPTLVNDSINVDDTNGSSWPFSSSGSVTYDKTFTSANSGDNENTATIRETGLAASANVTVNTYTLQVSKTANTSLTRTYKWSINKTADQSNITLALNQTFPVNYTVTVNSNFDDSNWYAAGTISIHNPAPMDAVINSINDIVAPDIAAATNFGVSFPYTLAAGATLNGKYTSSLPDGTERTNTAAAVLQNYAYDSQNNAAAFGTTTFTGTADVNFENADISLIDENVNVTDTLAGNLGTVSYNNVTKAFNYVWTAGPYTSSGNYPVNNTASFTTNDTGAAGSSSWTVIIHVPNQGATLTIGYWKNHAGSGPQKDMVKQYLPIWLGTSGGTVSIQVTSTDQAVKYLSMNGDASNGINKLYAQLLAARLNQANGTDITPIKQTLTDSDAFLATHNNLSWSSLSKADRNKVIVWASTLDSYNKGNLGVPHATE